MDGLVRPAPARRIWLAAGCAAALVALALAALGPGAATAAVQTEDLTLQTQDTPKIRFEQTNAGGFTPHTWDIAGNEAQFFVRDITGGSRIPFRIWAGAPASSLNVDDDGDIGIGTPSPDGSMEIARDADVNLLYTATGPDPEVSWTSGIPASGGTFTIGLTGAATPAVAVLPGGDLTAAGSLAELATPGNVSGLTAIDPAQVLRKVEALPVRSWTFAASPDGRHLGPLAGDFSASFGLGSSAALAPGDVAGVALAAIQGLLAENRSLSARVETAETAAVEAKAAAAEAKAAAGRAPEREAAAGKVPAVDAGARTANAKLSRRVRKLGKQMKRLRRLVRSARNGL